ncbi:MAG: hypothetical protein VKK04_12490 [Synechococcales bacterium]|nr:hypothetical protein [Synechococcales bacterium]
MPVGFGAISAVLSGLVGQAPAAIAQSPPTAPKFLPSSLVQTMAEIKAAETAPPATGAIAPALPPPTSALPSAENSSSLSPSRPHPSEPSADLDRRPASVLMPSLQIPHSSPLLRRRSESVQISQAVPPGEAEPSDPDTPGDPELGILRLRELPEATLELEDPELGRLRLRETVLQPQAVRPTVFFTARTSGFWSDNIFSFVDPIEDGIFQSGISLRAVPALGDRTFLTASVEGNLVRYFDQSDFSYNEFELRASLFRAITRRTYVDLGWNHQLLFERDGGERFFSDHQLRLSLGRRDRLTNRLDLNTSYLLQLSFTDPEDRSRAINRLNASLGYDITSRLRSDLFYQFSLIDFTKRDRNDYYHQLLAQLTYSLSSETRIFLYGGGRLGSSSDDRINFDGLLFGVGLVYNFS